MSGQVKGAGILRMAPAPSRREAIKFGLAALAGLGISALAPATAYATTGNMQFGAYNNAGSSWTSLDSSNENYTFGIGNTDTGSGGRALFITKTSGAGNAAYVHHGGPGLAVYAHDTGPSGGALLAQVQNAANSAAAVRAVTGGTGYAVLAQGDKALRVEGRMTMTRSGKAYIAKGKSSKTVTVPYVLSSSVSILCTPQDSAGSGVHVRYAQRVSGTRFKIVLNKACTSSVRVAYMILG